MLTIHLYNHENTSTAQEEGRFEHLQEHMRWDAAFAGQVVKRAQETNLVRRQNNHLLLTETGRERAQHALTR